MKRSLIGLIAISCTLFTPSWNKFDSFQSFRLEIGQPAEAAPKFKLPKIPPSFRKKVLQFLGNKVEEYVVSETINTILNSPNSRPKIPTIQFAGNLCESEAGRVYIVTSQGDWIYFNGSRWKDISLPSYTVACYLDLGMNSSGELYSRSRSQIFGYVPNVGWVIPQ